ncbi:hypothetical protein KAJ77_04240, partial [bacterium]|nr:hypothetical protein [bacterium]
MSDKIKNHNALIPVAQSQEEVSAIVSPVDEVNRWYVIRSKPRYETTCLDELAKAGFEALCPMGMDYRWRRRRQEAVPL